jgi:hypothetical protein
MSRAEVHMRILMSNGTPRRLQDADRRRSSGHRLKLAAALGLVMAGLLALGGCRSSSSGSETSTTAASPVSTTKPVPRHVLVATYADNGGTLTVQVHDRLRVVLAGRAWTQSSTNPSVIAVSGKPVVLPVSSGCVTGQGCGSVTVYYQAMKVGVAQIEANRSRCDSAVKTCTTGPGAFRMKVVVTSHA